MEKSSQNVDIIHGSTREQFANLVSQVVVLDLPV